MPRGSHAVNAYANIALTYKVLIEKYRKECIDLLIKLNLYLKQWRVNCDILMICQDFGGDETSP